MKTLPERNRILNEIKDSCYLAFFDGNPEEGGVEIKSPRKKIDFPTAEYGYLKSLNQIDFLGGAGVVSGEGKAFVLQDTVEYKLSDIKIKGDTTQQTYSGKNLMDISNYSGAFNSTYSVNGNSILVTNTRPNLSSCYIAVEIPNSDSLLGKTATLKIGKTSATSSEPHLEVAIYQSSGGSSVAGLVTAMSNLPASGGTKSFTFPASYSSGQVKFVMLFYSGTFDGSSNTSTYSDVQIELGSTATDYEPYVGGTASPNPEYPQDVNVVTGEQKIIVSGKNLFSTEFSSDFSATDNNQFTLNRTSLRVSRFYFPCDLPAGTYTLSFDIKSNTAPQGINFNFFDASNNSLGNLSTIKTSPYSRSITFSRPLHMIYAFIQSSDADNTHITVNNFQLEYGSTKTDFVPYKDTEEYNVNLGSIELCKIGDYQDKIYKQGGDWYLHKEVVKISPNGTEEWKTTGTPPSGQFYAYTTAFDSIVKTKVYSDLVSDNFTVWGGNPKWLTPATVTNGAVFSNTDAGGTAALRIMFPSSVASSVATVKTWLASNLPVFYYPIATPTDTKITDETLVGQLNDLAEATSYDGTTSFATTASGLAGDLFAEAYVETPEEATGVAKYWGIFDSATGGKLLYYFVLPYEVRILKGSSITIKAGNCVLKEG